ncbi:MAG: prefoldin subunit alpha [Candidatus Hodarchaeota archaeon]
MANPTMTEEDINRIRVLQAEIDQLQININAIEQQTALISSAISSINDAITTQKVLKTKKPGDEILVPIGGNNYILCSVKEPKKTFISLGSGISLLTDRESSEERNIKHTENLEDSIKQLHSQYTKFSQILNERRQEFFQIAQKLQLTE